MRNAAEVELLSRDAVDSKHHEIGIARADFLQDSLLRGAVSAKHGSDVDIVACRGYRRVLEYRFLSAERNAGAATSRALVPRSRHIDDPQRVRAHMGQRDGDFRAASRHGAA